MSFPFIIQGKNLTVFIEDRVHTLNRDTHISYNRVVDAIKASDWDTVRDLIEPKKAVLNYGAGNIEIQGSTLFWKGIKMHNALTRKIIEMMTEGFPVAPMVNFMENLMENPSKRAVEELYGFLEKGNLPITDDGHFLAYKKVRNDYLDIHSGTVSNAVGNVVEMPRNMVDDDANRTCSAGLHFCSKEYLPHFGRSTGDRVVILKINPRDVVSIPSDYNNSKGRCCRYEVIGEILPESTDTAFDKAVQNNASNPVKVTSKNPPAAPATPAASVTAPVTSTPTVTSAGRPLSMSPDAIRRREFRRKHGY